jgi:hypothetical protein
VGRGDAAPPAGGEHDAASGDEAPPVDLDRPRADDAGLAAQEPAALALEALDGDLVVPAGGGLPHPGGHRRPRRRGRGPAGQPVDPAGLGQRVAGPHDDLGGDAAPVGAFAADQLPLDAEDVHAGFGGPAGDLLAADAHADHDQVGLLLHRGQPFLTPVPLLPVPHRFRHRPAWLSSPLSAR